MDLGDTLEFRSDLKDADGVLINATTATLTISLPDGTTATPTVTNPPTVTGKYAVDYVTLVTGPSGRYVGRWLFTVSGGKTTSFSQSFSVGTVLTLSEAKVHLNIPAATTTNDEELYGIIEAAEAAISSKCGPLVSTTVTERVDGYSRRLTLTTAPVLSITSVTPVGGSALSLTDLDTRLSAGVIATLSGGGFPQARYDVVYAAGRSSVPADLLMAIKEQVRHLWRTQLGDPVGSGFYSDGQNPGAGAVSGWSPLALQLMVPHSQDRIVR